MSTSPDKPLAPDKAHEIDTKNPYQPGAAGITPPDPYETLPPEPLSADKRFDPYATRGSETSGDFLALVDAPKDDSAKSPSGEIRRFGHFLLLERIARGGMGEVWKAQELRPETSTSSTPKVVRVVALKRILRERIGAQDAVARFDRETQAAKNLDHPGIVPVYESGVVQGEHYFTMPYVPGGSLQQYVVDDVRKRLTPRQAARIMRQVAEAVQYAHDHKPQIIHRDIKPQNIVLQPQVASSLDVSSGESLVLMTPRLTDFGLARLVDEDSSLSISQKGEIMGTPGYMPPEQAAGNLEAIGPGSDIYSLGAVLYALLTGKPPFPLKAATSYNVIKTLNDVQNEEPLRPRQLNTDVPSELEDICLKCLEKEPEKRYRSALELAEALDDVVAYRTPIRHTPRRSGWLGRAQQRLMRSIRRHPWRTAYIAVSAVAIVALAVGVYSWSQSVKAGILQLEQEAKHHAGKGKELESGGNSKQAIDEYLKAITKYEELLGKQSRHVSEFEVRLQHAELQSKRSDLLRRDPATWEQAKTQFEAALEELLDLQKTNGGDPRLRRLLAETYHCLGALWAYGQKPDLQQAMTYFSQKSLPLRKELCAQSPGDPQLKRDLARNYGFMGDVQLELGDVAGAEKSYDEAASLREDIVKHYRSGGDAADLLKAMCQRARDYTNLGNLRERMNQPKEALQAHRRCLEYCEKPPFSLTQSLPGEFRMDRPAARITLANLLLDLGLAEEEAMELVDKAIAEIKELVQRIGGEDKELSRHLAWALQVRGKGWALADEVDAARSDLVEAKRRLEELSGRQVDDRFRLACAHAWLARLAEPGEETRSAGWAMDELDKARKAGFKHLPRLRREAGFRSLQTGSTKKEFADLIREMEQAQQK